ncbi:lipopolysaccharide biosynthesis protein [Streptomyces sp. NPDC020719]|uniref:lipopolysaccharide biosynthesis protein n=1 Tax=Streptomyces sp. NPDC020719 TaxID=3154896 RepID=UPI0034074537
MSESPSPWRRARSSVASVASVGTYRARPLPRWWPLPACALLGTVVGGVYGLVRPPEYSATSYVVVTPTGKSDPATALGFAQAYGRVATQVAVIGDAQAWAGVPAETIRRDVQTATSPDAPMIAITGSSRRPDQAADIANAVARALTLNGRHTEASTGVRLVQFSRAARPVDPSSAPASLTALVGGCAGGLTGALVLLVRRRPGRKEQPAPVPSPAGRAPAAELTAARPGGGAQ